MHWIKIFALQLAVSANFFSPAVLAEPTISDETTLVAPPVGAVITSAVRVSLAALQEMGDPVLHNNARIAFQTILDKPEDVSILLVSHATGPKNVLPELCMAQQARDLRKVRICDYEGKCAVPSDTRIILCNLETIKKLQTLITAIHDSDLINKYMTSDRAFMRMAKVINTDSERLEAEIVSRPADDHLFAHMLFLLTAVFAHEFNHLAEHQTHDNAGDAKPDILVGSKAVESLTNEQAAGFDGAGAERVCRNYLQFEANGLKLLGQRGMTGLAYVAITAEDQDAINAVRPVWAKEIAADKYAAAMLVKLMRKVVEGGVANLDDVAVDYVAQTLATVSKYYWYLRLVDFAGAACSEEEDQTYFLTRCLCKDRNRFSMAEGLFSNTHPLLYIRIYSILKDVFGENGFRVSELGANAQEMLRSRMQMMEHLMETPSKIALGACLLRNVNVFRQTRFVVMDYPAIEGFFGNDVNPGYVGAPPDALKNEIWQNCMSRR